MASTFIIMSVWVTFGMGATYNDTTVIQLGVIGNSSAFTGVSGFWTTSLPPSSQDEHNTLYRISLDTSQPFTILRHTRGIARVSDILLLSGHPIYINSTLRLLSDQIQTMGVYEALTASSSQFCRLQNASNPITQYSSLPYRSFGSHPRWTIVPLTCYHLSPVDPIISVLFWVKWKSIIIISDESAEGLPGALLSHLYDKDIMTLHQRLHVNTSAASINDLLLHHYNRKERHAPNFILLCGWPLVERIFKMVREMDDEKFTAMFFYTKWITVCRRSQLSVYGKLVNAMNNVLLVTLDAGLSPVILSDNVPWCKADAELWSSLGPSGRGPGGMSRLGCWFRHTGVIFTHDPFPNFGFNARLFRVGVFEWRPFIIENLTYGENYTGFCIDIARNLAQALNFSYTFMTASDGESDAFAGNDTWKGIPRDIINGLLDFSIAPFARTGERELVLDFTYDYFTDYNVILTKRFTKENSWRLVIDIFSWPVIVVIVAAVPTTAIVIYVLEAWNPYPFPVSYQSRGVGRLGQLVWYTYGALLSQGGSHIPVSQAGRTMVAFWWLFSIMLTATFSGNLIAFLTVPKSFVPFQSIESMVHQNQFSWGLSNTSSFFRFLQTTNITPYDAVWRGVRHQDFHQETHVDRVLRENYVYLGDKSGCLYHMTSHCELTVSKQEFFPLKYAIALPKGSPYNGIFSKKLSQMTESGLILKWRKKWWPPRNCPSKTTNAKKMTLGDVQSAFYLLIIGTVLGVIAVTCEKIYSNVSARGRTKPPVEDKRLQRNERTKSVLCGCITGRFSAEVGSSNQAASSEDHMCSYADADRKSVSERDSIENGLGEVKTIV